MSTMVNLFSGSVVGENTNIQTRKYSSILNGKKKKLKKLNKGFLFMFDANFTVRTDTVCHRVSRPHPVNIVSIKSGINICG